MSVTAIGPMRSTVHVTNTWLKELMEELGWEDRQRPATASWAWCFTPCAMG